MQSKKLELLLSKLPEEKKDAFLAEFNETAPDEYEALLERYGIVLDADEMEFLTAPFTETLSDSDLTGIVGGMGVDVKDNGGGCG